MAASLISFTGQPKARSKSQRTQPPPRWVGSAAIRPSFTGPGYPIVMRSYCQSSVSALTALTICAAVNVGLEGSWRRVACPVASTLMFVPPTSMTSVFISPPWNGMLTDAQRIVRAHADRDSARHRGGSDATIGPKRPIHHDTEDVVEPALDLRTFLRTFQDPQGPRDRFDGGQAVRAGGVA